MNITFLIGNGFDIQMGIASDCKTVVSHYSNLKKTDSTLQAFQDSMKKERDYWSSFETAIGEYTDSFEEKKQANFQLCLDDFSVELIQYLQLEESRIDYDLCLEEIQREFFRSFSEYDADIPNRYKNEINAIIAKHSDVSIRFISFNYTHVLDDCLKRAFTKDNRVIGKHKFRAGFFNHIVNNEVFHIHGELPGPIIIGVDNQDQISNKKWAEQRRFQQRLLKPAINSRAGSMVDDNVKQLILESSIICIFGMSLGDTDKTWWKLLGNWLKGDDRRLVIFGHNDDYSQIGYTHPRQFALQDDLIDRFLDLAEIQDAVRDDLSNKIFAIINPNLFNINLVKMTAQKKKEENKPEFHNGFDDENDLSFIDIQNLLQYKQAQIQEANDLELQFAKDSPLFENAMTDYQNILNMFPQSLIDEAKEWKKTHHEQL